MRYFALLLTSMFLLVGVGSNNQALADASAPYDVYLELFSEDVVAVFTGMSIGDGFSSAITVADINGDSQDDMIVASPYTSVGIPHVQGVVYVFLGPFVDSPYQFAADDPDLILRNNVVMSRTVLGRYLDSGDMNGDGYDDIVVGTWGDSPSGNVYVYLGNSQLRNGKLQVYDIEENNTALAISNVRDGILLCDINADNYDDLFVRQLGYKYTGKVGIMGVLGNSTLTMTSPLLLDTVQNSFDITITYSVDSWISPNPYGWVCGDVDGDKIDDLVIGVPWRIPYNGLVYIVKGSSDFSQSKPTLELPKDANLILQGQDSGGLDPAEGDLLGEQVKLADINRDGLQDIIVLAGGGDGPNNAVTDIGEIYVWLGRELSGQTVMIEDEAASIIYGVASGTGWGFPLAAGDLNHDAYPELVIGCGGCEMRYSNSAAIGGTWFAIDSTHLVSETKVMDIASLVIHNEQNSIETYGTDTFLKFSNDENVMVLGTTNKYGMIYLVSYPNMFRQWLPLIEK